jgi:hypothetical protein
MTTGLPGAAAMQRPYDPAMSKLTEDPRIDPRLKALFGKMPVVRGRDLSSRDEVLERNRSEKAVAARAAMARFVERADTEEIAPSAGLTVTTETFVSEPDGNPIKVQFVRPEHAGERPACVYYLHGRPRWRRSGDGGLPQRRHPVLRPGGRAVPGGSQRLRVGRVVAGRQQRPAGHRPRPHRGGR